VKFSFLKSEVSLFDNEKFPSESQISISVKSEEFYSSKEESEVHKMKLASVHTILMKIDSFNVK